MSALNFPSSPTLNQTYSANGKTWRWDGTTWVFHTPALASADVVTALGYTPYDSANPSGYITSAALSPYLTSATAASTYQTTLVSGTNIKTVNCTSLLGSGNISVSVACATPTVAGKVYGRTQNICGGGRVALGHYAGNSGQGAAAIAIGLNAGLTMQPAGSIAIGENAVANNPFCEYYLTNPVAVGKSAYASDSGVAFGPNARAGTQAVAIGSNAGICSGPLSSYAVSIGAGAQTYNSPGSVALGAFNGGNCAANAVTIGYGAFANAPRTVVINATGSVVFAPTSDSTHLAPVRAVCSTSGLQGLFYCNSTKEVIRGAVAAPSSATPTVAGIVYGRTEGCIMMCGSGRTAVGYRAGNGSQGANTVAIGCRAGQVSQGACAVAVGQSAGCSSQGAGAVAIGVLAGAANQGACAVAIGKTASQNSQSSQAVAIGANAGGTCSQGIASIAIGYGSGAAAGCACFPQSPQSVAVGTNARAVSCSVFAVAIGPGANALGAPNSVAIGHCVMASGGCQTHIGPIRPVCSTSGLQGLFYNACTREVIRGSAGGGGSPATPCTAGIVYGRTTTACGCINGKTALGAAAGNCSQGNFAVAVGFSAGVSSQGNQAVAIGQAAGASTQGVSAVAIGASAGNFGQSGAAVAVGSGAGNYTQGSVSVAVGTCAGYYYQGANSVAIGGYAGYFYQGANAVAVGQGAGGCYQSPCTVAIGAGTYANSTASSTHIGPVRNATTAYHLYYCPCSREITYG